MQYLRFPAERTELFPPAPMGEVELLSKRFGSFALEEYLTLLAQSNGVGEVIEIKQERVVHNMLLFSASEALEVSDTEFGGDVLSVGRLGVDGILFVLQPSSPAIYAYFPIDEEFRLVASSLQDFLDKWSAHGLRL